MPIHLEREFTEPRMICNRMPCYTQDEWYAYYFYERPERKQIYMSEHWTKIEEYPTKRRINFITLRCSFSFDGFFHIVKWFWCYSYGFVPREGKVLPPVYITFEPLLEIIVTKLSHNSLEILLPLDLARPPVEF